MRDDERTQLRVALKSGVIFAVFVKDVDAFQQSIISTVQKGIHAANNLLIEGPFVININEVAAVFPAGCHVETPTAVTLP